MKKNIEINNPALQFMSGAGQVETPKKKKPVRPKKTALETPVIAKGMQVVPQRKTERLQLLLRPYLLDALKEKAQAEGQSVNNLIHTILEEAIK